MANRSVGVLVRDLVRAMWRATVEPSKDINLLLGGAEGSIALGSVCLSDREACLICESATV